MEGALETETVVLPTKELTAEVTEPIEQNEAEDVVSTNVTNGSSVLVDHSAAGEGEMKAEGIKRKSFEEAEFVNSKKLKCGQPEGDEETDGLKEEEEAASVEEVEQKVEEKVEEQVNGEEVEKPAELPEEKEADAEEVEEKKDEPEKEAVDDDGAC